MHARCQGCIGHIEGDAATWAADRCGQGNVADTKKGRIGTADGDGCCGQIQGLHPGILNGKGAGNGRASVRAKVCMVVCSGRIVAIGDVHTVTPQVNLVGYAEQYGHIRRTSICHCQILLVVTVEVANRHRRRILARCNAIATSEATYAVAQADVHFASKNIASCNEVLFAVTVKVTYRYRSRGVANCHISADGEATCSISQQHGDVVGN